MKTPLLIIFISLFISHISKSQSFVTKISATEIEQFKTWHHLLGLDDGSSVFIYTDPSRTSFSIKRYDRDAIMTVDKKILDFKAEKGNKIEISEVLEINNNLVFFISFATKNKIKFMKIILDKQTGEKASEEELSSYSGLENKYIESKNYFIDFTKNDSTGIYYALTLVRTSDNTSELKVFGYNYEHKQTSAASKAISKSYNVVNFISGVQNGKSYYAVINFIEPIKKSFNANKQEVFLYHFSNGISDELPLLIEKTDRPYSYVSGQFTVNHNKQVRLALSNDYTFKIDNVNVDNPTISDVYVFGISKDKLGIENKYTVSQNKLHENYKNINNIKSKDKIYLYNYIVNFYTNPDNHDELIFQSYRDNRNGDALVTTTEDLGVYSFDVKGSVLNANHFLLKWDAMLYSFKYNLSDNGHAPNVFGYPSPLFNTPHKHIDFLAYKGKKFILFNDLIENLNITNRDEMNKFGRLRDATGFSVTINGSDINKSLLMNTSDQLYFDFTTASFNEKSGLYSVLINKNKKFYIAYLDLK
jgi:hypothetical protein